MPDLLITQEEPGVVKVTLTDPFSTLAIHRVDRTVWKRTPTESGVYLLWGIVDGQATVYIGMSTTDMRDRIRVHHVTPRKNWFGVLFAVPTPTGLCPPIEAELIRLVRDAGVAGIVDNRSSEDRWLDTDIVHVTPALERITSALEMLIGSDIFTIPLGDDAAATVNQAQRTPPLARVYRGAVEAPRARRPDDPQGATHAYVGAGVTAWGRFENDEPDPAFRVLAGSTWRTASPNPEAVSYSHQLRAQRLQQEGIDAGYLDEDGLTFLADHVFPNWTQAVVVISGKGQYAGPYHWQRLVG